MLNRNKMKFGMKRSAGFTLVEIAIVLVIIGLLLGGVLKGAQMIENSKAKRAVNEINGISAAFYAYQDRYNRLPGDDGDLARLQARGGAWANITEVGNANGALVVNRGSAWNNGGEQDSLWQHLRASGLLSGDPTATGAAALPRNAYGGLTSVVVEVMGANLLGAKVCMSQVPGDAALAIDTQLDDGLGASGQMQATVQTNANNVNPGAAALATEYNIANNYTVCVKM